MEMENNSTVDGGLDEEGEEENENEEKEDEKNSLIFWRFCTAAVLIAVSLFFYGVTLFIYKVCDFEKKLPKTLYLPLLVVLLFLPALNLDGYTSVSCLLLSIPALVAMLLLGIPIVWVMCRGRSSDAVLLLDTDPEGLLSINNNYSPPRSCPVPVSVPVWREGRWCVPCAYVFCLLGLVLHVLRLSDILPSSFPYTVILLFPLVGGYFIMWYVHIQREKDRDDCCFCGLRCIAPLIVYGALFLPFSLRKDQLFHTSYHFTLIGWYIATLPLGVAIFLISGVACFEGWERADEMDRHPVHFDRHASVLRQMLEGKTVNHSDYE